MADGFLASDCPPDDICCHAGWPFEDSHEGFDSSLYALFYSSGTAPWDVSTATGLVVSVDPSLTETTSTAACTGPDLGLGGSTPCGSVFNYAVRLGAADFRSIDIGPSDTAGWYPWLEVYEDAAGSKLGRVCAYAFTDTTSTTCPTRAVVCASSGSIVVNRWPADGSDTTSLVVAMNVDFANGLNLQAAMVH